MNISAIFLGCLLGFVIVLLVIRILLKKFNRITPLEIADIIDRFVQGKTTKWEWDDFISCPISDPSLDKIRLRCANLYVEYPPQKAGEYCNERGVQVLNEFVLHLRSLNG